MKNWLLILFFAILIGLYFGLGTIFGFFNLLIIFGICTPIFIVLLIIWKKPSKKFKYSIQIYTTIFFGLLFCLLFARLKNEYNQRKADLTVIKIQKYKTDFQRYPNSLAELKNETELPQYFDQFKFKDFDYIVNKSNGEFNLSYSLDGWHINEYDVNTNEWESRD
ncbi:O-antigen ligase family protein [Patiriisocius marinistellae]|uniref:O-antigen ligase family protein n=1 Tax=Patiriisocius marinistellae TaxID=2494560 RepID=UPI00125D0A06|nr:O-antigen ligase family protein [Patiriisocius marinistellae]